MPKVMIRRGENGALTVYVAKKDLEETVVALEHDGDDGWGGEVELADGSRYLLDRLDAAPDLPVTLRAKRL